MALNQVTRNHHNVHNENDGLDAQAISKPVEEANSGHRRVARTTANVHSHVVRSLAAVQHDEYRVEQGAVQAHSHDGSIVESDEVLFDELVVVDEEIAFDRCPSHEKDAELDEREVHDDPG